MRQICQGVNVDLGTAAAFREQWQREANMQPSSEPPIPLLLKTDQAPGDAVAMTAAIYSLHRAHPGKYLTAVESRWPDVFEYNPDVVPTKSIPDASWNEVRMHYPAIHQSNERSIHFMQGWCEFLGMALGIQVPLLTNRPHLYFDVDNPPVEDYWVICSGGKRDFTNKLWGYGNYREVVERLSSISRQPTPVVKFVQVGSGSDAHCRIPGTVDMLGKTNLRQLFALVRRSRGVLCGVSLLMHVAAALEKPAVVVAGGREPVAWNAYPKQQYVHTIGALPCSDVHGKVGGACWRSRVLPLGDATVLDRHTCLRPVDGVPECMTMVRPVDVTELVLRYDRQYGPEARSNL
jgi:Glycosyltransferase family 9 (heptosyltransferase)